jgi:hypothetical protein
MDAGYMCRSMLSWGGDCDDADSACPIVHVWRYGRDPDDELEIFDVDRFLCPIRQGKRRYRDCRSSPRTVFFFSLVNDDLDPPLVAKHEASADPALLSLSRSAP